MDERMDEDGSRVTVEETPFIQMDSLKMESLDSYKKEYYPTPSHTPQHPASRFPHCLYVYFFKS